MDDLKRANQAELEETDETEEENVEGSEQVSVSREEKKRETKPRRKATPSGSLLSWLKPPTPTTTRKTTKKCKALSGTP